MDNKLKILLGSQKNIKSINVDNHNIIELVNNESKITEFTVNDVVNATEVFDTERENNSIYRIYGRIEYMSLLNGLKTDYELLEDFFNPQKTGSTKTILNSFDFYLLKTGTGYTKISNSDTNYLRYFEVMATPNEFELYPAGFSNNIYGEQTYAFSFNIDFDVSNLYDNFGFPMTELFLYAQYRKPNAEDMSNTKWSTTGNISKNSFVPRPLGTIAIGDTLTGNNSANISDLIEYVKEEYTQEQIGTQKYYIRTPYDAGTLEWSYNPFIPFRLRYLDSVLSTAKLSNIVESGTSLNINNINDSGNTINLTKSSKQNLSEIEKTITNWDSQTNTYYNWSPSTGILKFNNAGTYNIKFETQIYLSEDTDMYVAEIYLEKLTGGENIKITGTTRRFLINNTIEGVIINDDFNVDDGLRIRTRLIPNPNERKLEIIPDYATIIEDSGKYVWRDIVKQGYTEPITDLGVDYPFFNGKRYLFSPIVFSVVPNLSNDSFDKHANTINIFSNISYSDDAITIDKTPITELDKIGKPCQ
ncbi:MAG: hypothetical protein PF487_10570 [Bacteroidales bacterium]|jgi:hypothetical protein|nr:hypothetical protein [Bacteroidales bacterium]